MEVSAGHQTKKSAKPMWKQLLAGWWGWCCKAGLSPPVKYFYWPFQGGTSFVDHLCFLCLVFLMLSRLFIAALWSPPGKGLASWLLLVMFTVFLLLSHVVSWVRCGTWLYHFLIFAIFLTFINVLFLIGIVLPKLCCVYQIASLSFVCYWRPAAFYCRW